MIAQAIHAELLGYLQALMWAGIAVVCGVVAAFAGISAADHFLESWHGDEDPGH